MKFPTQSLNQAVIYQYVTGFIKYWVESLRVWASGPGSRRASCERGGANLPRHHRFARQGLPNFGVFEPTIFVKAYRIGKQESRFGKSRPANDRSRGKKTAILSPAGHKSEICWAAISRTGRIKSQEGVKGIGGGASTGTAPIFLRRPRSQRRSRRCGISTARCRSRTQLDKNYYFLYHF